MAKKIYGNTVGASSLPKTYLLTTEDGAELTGVLVGEETIFDATPNDVRIGKVYAGDNGVKTGEKVIPSYLTVEIVKVIPNGYPVVVQMENNDSYNYTKLQAIVCKFNTNLKDSVASYQVGIGDSVYEVNSTTSISEITKDHTNKSVNFGTINETGQPIIARCFSYKEI